MRPYLPECIKDIATALALIAGAVPLAAVAFSLIPDALKTTKINRYVWQLQEQYVALAPRVDQELARQVPDQHPVALDVGDVRDALLSLAIWIDGGFFVDEEAERVFKSRSGSDYGPICR